MKTNVYQMYLSEDRVPYLEKEKSFPLDNLVNGPDKQVDMINYIFRANQLPEEHVWVMAMDNCYRMTGVMEVSHGTNRLTLIQPREIFMRALLVGGTFVSVLHNHPSGNCTPSEEDKEVAERLKEAGKLIGVPLCDFIIIGTGYCSFREENLI